MTDYDLVILATFFGFLALAFLLLAPIYRFLKREEKASEQWTKEGLARRAREEPPSTNGRSHKKDKPAG